MHSPPPKAPTTLPHEFINKLKTGVTYELIRKNWLLVVIENIECLEKHIIGSDLL